MYTLFEIVIRQLQPLIQVNRCLPAQLLQRVAGHQLARRTVGFGGIERYGPLVPHNLSNPFSQFAYAVVMAAAHIQV